VFPARHLDPLFPFTRCATENNFHPRFFALSDFTHFRFHLLLYSQDHPVLKIFPFDRQEYPKFKKRTVKDRDKIELQCVSMADCAGPQPRWMNARNRLSGLRGCVKARFHVCIGARVNRV